MCQWVDEQADRVFLRFSLISSLLPAEKPCFVWVPVPQSIAYSATRRLRLSVKVFAGQLLRTLRQKKYYRTFRVSNTSSINKIANQDLGCPPELLFVSLATSDGES